MKIRELDTGEVALLKELRLRALKDAPGEFGDSYDAARQQPDSYWEETAASLTGAARQRMFIAEEGERHLGFVFALGDSRDPDGGSLGGMWVDSTERRRGVATALLEAAIRWATQVGMRRLRLWVADGDTPARRLNLRAGFEDTGERDETREKIDKDLVRMILDLPRGPDGE